MEKIFLGRSQKPCERKGDVRDVRVASDFLWRIKKDEKITGSTFLEKGLKTDYNFSNWNRCTWYMIGHCEALGTLSALGCCCCCWLHLSKIDRFDSGSLRHQLLIAAAAEWSWWWRRRRYAGSWSTASVAVVLGWWDRIFGASYLQIDCLELFKRSLTYDEFSWREYFVQKYLAVSYDAFLLRLMTGFVANGRLWDQFIISVAM